MDDYWGRQLALLSPIDDYRRKDDDLPLLHRMALWGDARDLRLFIQLHAPRINALDSKGRTALFYCETVRSAKVLLDAGINVHAKAPLFAYIGPGEFGPYSAAMRLHYGSRVYLEVALLLVEHGANPVPVLEKLKCIPNHKSVPNAQLLETYVARHLRCRGVATALLGVGRQSFPRDIVRMLAQCVWRTRTQEEWDEPGTIH